MQFGLVQEVKVSQAVENMCLQELFWDDEGKRVAGDWLRLDRCAVHMFYLLSIGVDNGIGERTSTHSLIYSSLEAFHL